MKRVFIFPGQGAQHIGMGSDIFQNYPAAKEVFNAVDSILQRKLSDTIFHGTEVELTETVNAQPALMTVSIAFIELIKLLSGKQIHEICSFVAGHSLGEYVALYAAGVINLEETTQLLKIRSSAMQDSPEGAMAACLNVTLNEIEEILDQCNNEGTCVVAGDNSENQVVISGDYRAIDRVVAILHDIGKRAIKLKVSRAFHSPFMIGASYKLNTAISSMTFRTPNVPIICNTTALPTTSIDEIKTNLINQITTRVRWRETIALLTQNHNIEIIEIGAGNTLTNMVKKSYLNVRCVSNQVQLLEFVKTL